MEFRLWRAWCFALPLCAPGTVAVAGIFDEPKNLKVLPADISPQELRNTMRGFALDLGVNCENCHVDEAGQPLENFDFAADDKDMKATVRLMLRIDSWRAGDGGIAFLHELRGEHGASFMTDLTLADLYLAAGKRERAIASLKAAHSGALSALQAVILKRLEGLEATAESGN